jgi:hypothetical protein
MITCGIVGVRPWKVWTVTTKKIPATLRETLTIYGTDDSGGAFGSAVMLENAGWARRTIVVEVEP